MARWWRKRQGERRLQSGAGEAAGEGPVPTAAAELGTQEPSPSTAAARVGAGAPGSEPPRSGAAAEDAARPSQPSPTGAGLSEVANQVGAVLTAAEATAATIRREAEADAERAAEARRRRRATESELVHLSRLADSLAVQAEAVKRQCGKVSEAFGPVSDDAGDRPSVESPPPSSSGDPRAAGLGESISPAAGASTPGGASMSGGVSTPAGASTSGGASPPAGASVSAAEGVSPAMPGAADAGRSTTEALADRPGPEPSKPRPDRTPEEARPVVPREPAGGVQSGPVGEDVLAAGDREPAGAADAPDELRIAAYRMRLAGADADEVRSHLERRDPDDAASVADELLGSKQRGGES